MTTNKAPEWISQSEWDALCDYASDIASRLRLCDWRIQIDHARLPDGGDNDATISVIDGKKLAKIKLSYEWQSLDPQGKRYTIVHELIHCHEFSMSRMVEGDLKKTLGEHVHALFWESYKRQLELMVDGIADAIAPLMPPFPQPKKHTKKRRTK
jgi:hypothetical protein